MQKSTLELLTDRGVVIISKKGSDYLVECVEKNEAGYLTGRQSAWGRRIGDVFSDLMEKVRTSNSGSGHQIRV